MICHRDFEDRYAEILATIVDEFPNNSFLLESRRIKIFYKHHQLSVSFVQNEFVDGRGQTSGCRMRDHAHPEWKWDIWFPKGDGLQNIPAIKNQTRGGLLRWKRLVCGAE